MIMTAKEYLKSRGLKNPPLDSGIKGCETSETNDRRLHASDLMEYYAKLLKPTWLPVNLNDDSLIQNGCLLRCRNEFITIGYYSILSQRFISHAGIIDNDNPVCWFYPLAFIEILLSTPVI